MRAKTSFNETIRRERVRSKRSEGCYQVTVVGHDVVLHPCGGLQLLPTVLAGERLLHIMLNKRQTHLTTNSIKKNPVNKFSAKPKKALFLIKSI